MNRFSIGERQVGEGAPVLFVAELSANHGHDKAIAMETIAAAARAGADAIKLQTYTPDTLTLKSDAPEFVVKTKNEWAGRTLHDLYTDAMTPWEWHEELMAAAKAHGLLCFSTPFDPTAVAFLESLDVPAHKVASFELVDLPLVEAMARTGKPMIISTGMASLADIEAAVKVCREAGNERIALLRCVSSYPARPETMDLASYDMLKGFGCVVGLSDHTRDATVAIAAVALGAKLIEKHFILRRDIGGPDSFFSLEPDEFASMVRTVRQAEAAIGHSRFGPAADELASTTFRRSLFLTRDVKSGEILTCDSIRSIRPRHGLPPAHLPVVLGRRASRNLRGATPLTWDAVGELPNTSVTLRAAATSDAERLLAWRNDPATRAMSIDRHEISAADHADWLNRTLDSPGRVLLIADHERAAVGTIRLDMLEHAQAQVSLTVAPEHRGKGHAPSMLRAVEPIGREKGIVRLVASIRPENRRSIQAFKVAGYYAFHEKSDMLWCERRIIPYS